MSGKKEKEKRKRNVIGETPGCLACGRPLHMTEIIARGVTPTVFGTILPVCTDNATQIPGVGLPLCLECIDKLVGLIQRETSRSKGNGEKS